MTSYTVKKVSGACQAINVDTNQVICNEGNEVVVGNNTYTALKRPSDQVCCIYRVIPALGGNPETFEQVCQEGQIVQA